MRQLTVKTTTTRRVDVMNYANRVFVQRNEEGYWHVYGEQTGDATGSGAILRLDSSKEKRLHVTVTAEDNVGFPVLLLLPDKSEVTREAVKLTFSDAAAKTKPCVTITNKDGAEETIDIYGHMGSWEAIASGLIF